ncbi:hypothetical protein [Pectobacterium phage PPWS1]|uniref:Uncharacterized protein n=1 Tax=Pectobacterium phage PPWS1 TaxID=1685500 RepID=A0A0N7KC12_9CAUD|nr:hypothetical protein HOR09_gp12 [Pectobacterium phage PPWS1]BAS69527.1 hypothetical protein [Pectobacterium phage PPWS1]
MFNVGDVVVCEERGTNKNIAVGCLYTVQHVYNTAYIAIINDRGALVRYPKCYFAVPENTTRGWDFAVADELRRNAHEAIDAYNEYIARKPETMYMKMFK